MKLEGGYKQLAGKVKQEIEIAAQRIGVVTTKREKEEKDNFGLTYLRDWTKGPKRLPSIAQVLPFSVLGDGGVGKSSLIYRFCYGNVFRKYFFLSFFSFLFFLPCLS